MNEELLNQISHQQARMEEQIKTLFNQQAEQRKLTESVHEMAATMKLMAQNIKSTETKVDDLRSDVDEIKSKPAKRWDGVISTLLTVIATAAITFVIARLGLN